MKIDNNKDKGKTGLALAIGYYGSNGYTISIPLNDTQDYDLIVDDGTHLYKVQVKFTNSINAYGSYQANLHSCGGTDGKVYKRVIDTSIDILFVVCANGQMFEIPKVDITQKNCICLNDISVEKYGVSFEFAAPVNPLHKRQKRLRVQKTNTCIDCGKPINKTATRCRECNKIYLKQNITNKYSKCPTKDELIQKLFEYDNLNQLQKFYNVAYVTIKHWLQKYDIPSAAADLKQFKQDYFKN